MAKNTTKSESQVSQYKLFDKIPSAVFYVLFIATTAFFFSSHLFGDMYFWDDFAEYVYPTQTFAARSAASGEIPFWNPYSFNGMPFIADLQVGFFYPMNRLLTLFVNPNGQVPIGAMQFIIILHFLIAQISMFTLLRHWKISKLGSAIGAISYSFSFLLVLHAFHPMIIYHLSWFPLVLMLFSKGLNENKPVYSIAAGLVLGLTLLSGHPQSTLYIFLFLGVYFVWRIVVKAKAKSLNAISLIAAVATFILAAGVFMIQYLPSQELADLSRRAEMTYEASSEGSLEFKQSLTALLPNLYGKSSGLNEQEFPFYLQVTNSQGETNAPSYYYWETGFYFGLTVLFFGLIGFINKPKDGARLFFMLMALFGFLYALGDNFFIHGIFFNLPLFENFRIPVRMMFFTSIGLSVLSGFAIDDIVKGEVEAKRFFIIAGVLLLVALSGLFGVAQAIAGTPNQYSDFVSSHSLSQAFILALIIAISYLALKSKLNPTIAFSVILVITFIDLYSAGSKFNQSSNNPEKQYEINGQLLELFKAKSPDKIFRVNTRMYNPSFMAMSRNQGLVSEIMLVEGYNPLVLDRVTPDMGSIEEIHDVLNVKYEIQLNPNSGQPGFVENLDLMPRAWLVNDYEVFSENEVNDKLKTGRYDLRNTVLLEEKSTISLSKNNSSEIGSVGISNYGINEIEFQVNANENAILCLSEVWYPAWKAYINGEETKILRANYSLRAVEVPAGSSKITFKYESEAYAKGSLLSMISFIGGLFAMLFIVILSKKKKPDAA